jgi:hypothetical protein
MRLGTGEHVKTEDVTFGRDWGRGEGIADEASGLQRRGRIPAVEFLAEFN